MNIKERLYEINDKRIAIICNNPEYTKRIYKEYENSSQDIWIYYEDETCVRMCGRKLVYGSFDYYKYHTKSSFIYYEDFIAGDYYIVNDKVVCMNEKSQINI